MTFNEYFDQQFKDTNFGTEALCQAFRETARNAWNSALVEAADLVVKKYDKHEIGLEILSLSEKI